MLPWLSKTSNLCCGQLTSTMTFISLQTKRKFKIYHKINCKSEYVIYLMNFIRFRLNNHRNDTKIPTVILACSYFQQQGHNFHRYAKFVITDKLVNDSSFKEILHERLIPRENFWIQKLKNLVPYRLKHELNK